MKIENRKKLGDVIKEYKEKIQIISISLLQLADME